MSGKGRSRAVALLLALVAGASSVPDALAAPKPEAWLEERAAALGVDFTHHSGRSGRYLTPEIMGPGVAMLDADGDGDLDLFFVDGGSFDPGGAGKPGATAARPRLFRNQLVETGALRFVDVTEASGIVPCAYGMGVAAGDYDNDGRVDLYVTCVGSNQLWHNEGNGAGGVPRFRDVTAAAHADDPRWSVAASFFDFDRDGWLDLYVGNYLRFSPAATPMP